MSTDLSQRMMAAIRAHQGGDLGAAEAAYRAVLAAYPEQPDALHYLGVIAYQQDDLDQAARLIGQARQLKPGDPAVAANLGLVYQGQGRGAEAEAQFEASLDLEPRQPEAWFNLGLGRMQRHRYPEACDCFRRVLGLNDGHVQARRHLGLGLLALGQGGPAAEALSSCVEHAPDDARLKFELGRARELAGDLDKAAEAFETASESETEIRPKALSRLSVVRRRQHRLDDALAAARTAVAGDADDPDALRSLGHCLKALGQLAEAGDVYRKAHRIFRDPAAAATTGLATFDTTTRAKLRHDAEQLDWLVASGRHVDTLAPIAAMTRTALAGLPAAADDGELVPAPTSGDWYNRCHYLQPADRIPGGALGSGVDAAIVEADYHQRAPGITWIDDFLAPEALASLRRFCLSSTIWYDCDHPNGYLGAYLQDGFCNPLLLQIAEDLRAALPGIFGDHRLMQLWAYKYDSRMSGIDIHADFAAVNVNFWITPTEANLDPDHGGMVIWDVEAPLEWTLDEYNTYDPAQQAAIRQFLVDHNASEIVIPHRQNRCAVFNSNLLHRTDDIHFRDGYENRRINITMLFGHRGG
jgi:tetratricopeptide (TPR) repeat protein